jgi:hypothetical protein
MLYYVTGHPVFKLAPITCVTAHSFLGGVAAQLRVTCVGIASGARSVAVTCASAAADAFTLVGIGEIES